MKISLLAIISLFLLCGATYADAEKSDVQGTIVSVRGNILQIRPTLRPKLIRASFSDKTEVLSYRRGDHTLLKPGMRVLMGGPYGEQTGFHPFFIVAATEPIGELKGSDSGIKSDRPGWGNGIGVLKSVEPLIFTDSAGKDYTASTDRLGAYFELYRGDRNTLLIGTRMDLVGPATPDGVIQAESITVDRNYAATGTMFGVVVGTTGGVLHVRPRYTQDVIDVSLTPGATIQQEIAVDPDTIHPGDTVTFWAQRGNDPTTQNELHPVALLLGPGRYPAATEGDEAAAYFTGRLTSLDPVLIQLPDRTILNVIIPAQMITARLVARGREALKPGTSVLLVLRRADSDHFTTASVIVDASPFVGYGG